MGSDSAKAAILGGRGTFSPLVSTDALRGGRLRRVDASHRWFATLRARRLAVRAVADDGAEILHLADPSFAPLGAGLRLRLGVPVTADVARSDLPRSADSAGPWLRALEQIDAVFVDDELTYRVLRQHAPRADLTLRPPSAAPLPAATDRLRRGVERALAGTEPGRFVLAIPAGLPPTTLAGFVDALIPALDFAPLWVVFGAEARAAGRQVTRALERPRAVRVVRRPADARTIAAVAPYADAFVLPAGCCGERILDANRSLMLASSGVPVIAAHDSSAPVLRHEQNALLVDGSRDGWSLALNGLVALPPLQRQALGESFAARSFQLFPLSAALQAYEERFAALLGRPHIPLELRAA